MIEKARILIVEDDLNLGFLLMDFLEKENYKVKWCKDGQSGLNTICKNCFDLCILDVMMPNIDGFSLAKRMKHEGVTAPFIFLTAKSMKEDKLNGYNIGAEDYITKPFDEEELLCKINVILRRNESDAFENAPSQFKIGGFVFDANRLELKYKTKVHRLTEKESEVLRLLCIHKNEVLRREDAVFKIYGKKDYFLGRSFDVYISRLRKLLSIDPSLEIQNVYKVGFILNEIEKTVA